jgi:hypothetical protein
MIRLDFNGHLKKNVIPAFAGMTGKNGKETANGIVQSLTFSTSPW